MKVHLLCRRNTAVCLYDLLYHPAVRQCYASGELEFCTKLLLLRWYLVIFVVRTFYV